MAWRRKVRALLAAAAAATTAAATPCSVAPLQALENGTFVRMDRMPEVVYTTCDEYTAGACPIAVAFPRFPCLVTCVVSQQECAGKNLHQASIDPLWSNDTCIGCPITACAECKFKSAGSWNATCKRCFSGFVGEGGSPGEWTSCVLWNNGAVMVFCGAVACLVGLLLLGALGALCYGVWTSGSASPEPEQELHGVDTASFNGAPSREQVERNRKAIVQGLEHSRKGSVKAAAGRMQARFDARGGDGTPRPREEFADMGLGLQIFFRSQKFFICVSLVIWAFSIMTGDRELFANLDPEDNSGSLTPGREVCENSVVFTPQFREKLEQYADKMCIGCPLLWVVLVVMAGIFHAMQLRYIEDFDKRTLSAEDYTIRLKNLPPSATSEEDLKTVLEDALVARGQIHGVCICYNVLHKEERFVEMVDHLVESDDRKFNWYDERLGRPQAELDLKLEEDRRELTRMLTDGELKGSGEAYVVFKKQEEVLRVLSTRTGIEKDWLDRAGWTDGQGPVQILKDRSEPAGIRFMEYMVDQKELNRQMYVRIPAKLLFYVFLYGVAAQAFYMAMIKPYQDNMIDEEVPELSVQAVGHLLIGFNFIIQTLVMFHCERAGFVHVADVDRTTFLGNTFLLLVTNAYLLLQECFREGVRWELLPPGEQQGPRYWEWSRTFPESLRVEQGIGERLSGVMTSQIMLLYVLGEVGNVLAPVIIFHIIVRLVYHFNIGGRPDSYLQAMLRKVFFRGSQDPNISVREAEKAQVLVPLLLWMEYTYMVVFPAMAFVIFYLLTDRASTVCMWLAFFSVLFWLWQRYVMLVFYGKCEYDSDIGYKSFMRVFGVALSMLPPASTWWQWRLNRISDQLITVQLMLALYILALGLYERLLRLVEELHGHGDVGVDDFRDFPGGQDPGYVQVMKDTEMSWWNMNPIYVLKNRHCPDLEKHKVHSPGHQRDAPFWPPGHQTEGFFELGKEFRHYQNPDDRSPDSGDGVPEAP